MPRPLFVLPVIATLIVSGCSGPTSPSATRPLVERIAGVWTLTERQLAGESAVTPPAPSTFTFQVADGRASVKADCNQCGGAAVVSEDSITVGPALACTRAFCTLSAPYDTEFVQLLSGDNTATVEGDTLILQSPRGVLRFRK